MKDLNFSLSDNLYYLDQIGSVDDQLDFLSNLLIQDAQFCVTEDGNELVNLCVLFTDCRVPCSKLFVIRPGLDIRTFSHYRVINLPRWLVLNGYYCYQIVKSFKHQRLCRLEEEDTVGVTTVAVEDPSLSEDLECGSFS